MMTYSAPTPPSTPMPLDVRRADGFLSRLGGLLVLSPLSDGQGLLLVPCSSVHTAFMRYAIDVVFLDRAGVVKKIVPGLKPWRAAACPGAHQTLELAAGQAEQRGLAVGDTPLREICRGAPEIPA
ncbi:MAG: DUF192 domain-containing protein [Pseudomonadota bacterium]